MKGEFEKLVEEKQKISNRLRAARKEIKALKATRLLNFREVLLNRQRAALKERVMKNLRDQLREARASKLLETNNYEHLEELRSLLKRILV